MRFAKIALVVGLATLLAVSVTPWPDDWDALGFVASIARFDLDKFAPHPPGYPVYVALLRAAAWFASSGVGAGNAVAVASGAASAALMMGAVSRFMATATATTTATPTATPTMASVAIVAAVMATPLVFRCASSIGSEAPALAFASLALFALTLRGRRGAVLLGVAVGLGLGVRLSWGPLFVPMLVFAPRGSRVRALIAASLAVLLWAVPLAIVVGPRHLVSLLFAHAEGHASRWGGTALTDPARVRFLARDLFVDGLGAGGDALGVTIALLAAVVLAFGLLAWHRARWRGARLVAMIALPYLAWIAVGQNLRHQPRHVLPLVALLAAGLTLAAFADRRARWPGVALVLLVVVRTVGDARDRCAIPPPGTQLVALVRTLPDPSRIAVFGGASVRFFESTELAPRAVTAGSMGDVIVALGRMNELPGRVLVTSEIDALEESPYALDSLTTLCRPARMDRRAPCLDVYELHTPFTAP